MDAKILFTDLDGTLLNRKKEITRENQDAISRALEAGHKVVLNTGRPLTGCLEQIKELKLNREGCYAITFNGGLLYDCLTGKTLYKKVIPLEYVQYIFQETKKRGIYCQTYSDEGVLSAQLTSELKFYAERTHTPYKIIPDLPNQLAEEPVKVLAIDLSRDTTALDDYRRDMQEWAKDKVSIFYSSQCYLEHVPYGISKGAAIQHLCEYLNLPLSSTVAVGDEENDLTMIQTAHVGVAMANAISQVKTYADYVTKNDCDHSGVAEVIERFLLSDTPLPAK